jgi:hypothetical protein
VSDPDTVSREKHHRERNRLYAATPAGRESNRERQRRYRERQRAEEPIEDDESR